MATSASRNQRRRQLVELGTEDRAGNQRWEHRNLQTTRRQLLKTRLGTLDRVGGTSEITKESNKTITESQVRTWDRVGNKYGIQTNEGIKEDEEENKKTKEKKLRSLAAMAATLCHRASSSELHCIVQHSHSQPHNTHLHAQSVSFSRHDEFETNRTRFGYLVVEFDRRPRSAGRVRRRSFEVYGSSGEASASSGEFRDDEKSFVGDRLVAPKGGSATLDEKNVGGEREEGVSVDSGNGSGNGSAGGGDGGGGGGDGSEGGGEEDAEEKEFGVLLNEEQIKRQLESRGISLPVDMAEAAKTEGIRELILLRYFELQVWLLLMLDVLKVCLIVSSRIEEWEQEVSLFLIERHDASRKPTSRPLSYPCGQFVCTGLVLISFRLLLTQSLSVIFRSGVQIWEFLSVASEGEIGRICHSKVSLLAHFHCT